MRIKVEGADKHNVYVRDQGVFLKLGEKTELNLTDEVRQKVAEGRLKDIDGVIEKEDKETAVKDKPKKPKKDKPKSEPKDDAPDYSFDATGGKCIVPECEKGDEPYSDTEHGRKFYKAHMKDKHSIDVD